MGDGRRVTLLDTVLGSAEASSAAKVMTIKALASLGTEEGEQVLERHVENILQSDRSILVLNAYEYLTPIDRFQAILYKHINSQLTRLASMDPNQIAIDDSGLFYKLCNVTRRAVRNKQMPLEYCNEIEQTTKRFILSRKEDKYGASAASLFSELTDGNDGEFVEVLLESKNPRIRRAGVRSVFKCNREEKKRHLPSLMKVLDDPDATTRDEALCVIRRYRGERVGSGLSQEEFMREKERIKNWWKTALEREQSTKGLDN